MNYSNGQIGQAYATGVASAGSARRGRVASLTDQQRALTATLSDLAARLHKHCDAVGGSVPLPGAEAAINQPDRPGSLGELEDALHAAVRSAEWIRSAVDRVEEI